MYQLNYLSILLILLAFFIFYNEFNKKLSLADMCLLTIAFIAILRASYNYIQIDNSLNLNGKKHKYEPFINKRNKSKSKRIHSTNNNDDEDNSKNPFNDNDERKIRNDFINLSSEESNEYLDIENDNRDSNVINSLNDDTNYNDYNSSDSSNLINRDAVNNIDALLGIGIHNKEMFSDTPEPKDDIKSMFMPKIVIGKNDSSSDNPSKWNSVFGGHEFDYRDSRRRRKQRDDEDDEDEEEDGEKCDGGSGSRYGRVGNGNSYDSISSDKDIATYTDKKRCAKYDDRDDINEDGSSVVKNYKDAKTWYPGYTYLPPSNWNVPQKYPPACLAPSPDSIKLTGLVDRGLPMNVLELHPYDGKIAKTEDSVSLTNVGSILPKFKYEEQPFSKPYI
jgi:hypothetical protein